MSLNIKTSSGLQKLTPEVNNSTITAAIGYTPADKDDQDAHIANSNIHVTLEEKERWGWASTFSGNFDDLLNNPIETVSEESFILVDNNNIKAFEVTSSGVTHVAKLKVGTETLEEIIDKKIPVTEDPKYIDIVPLYEKDLTVSEWAKKKFEGNVLEAVSDMTISFETEDNFVIADPQGRKAFEILGEGITKVANLEAKLGDFEEVKINGKPVDTIIEEEVNEILANTSTDYSTIVPEYEEDPTVPDWAKQQNPPTYDKGDVGLDKVDNTADMDKPVSTAQRVAISAVSLEVSQAVHAQELHEQNFNNPHQVTGEQIGIGDITEDGSGSFSVVDEANNKAFEIMPDGTLNISKISSGAAEVLSIDANNINIGNLDADLPWGIKIEDSSMSLYHVDKIFVDNEGDPYMPQNAVLCSDEAGWVKWSTDYVKEDALFQLADEVSQLEDRINYLEENPSSGGSGTVVSGDYLPLNGSKTMTGTIKMGGNNIENAGTVQAMTFLANSDKRLKENLRPISPKNSILSLPTYEFDFINGPKEQIGCLAQDLVTIHPKLVNVDENGYMSINETKLIYLLLEEVKQLRTEIEKLKKGV